ncbi:MAG: ATP-binding cassette domain-containing protein [Bacteroidia bacterium]
MIITLQNIGKKYNRERIFGGLNHTFEKEHSVILGSNGSGKSTLLQIIAGHTSASEGIISYVHDEKPVSPENLFRYISYAAPYMELLEELNLEEHIAFHAGLKPLRPGLELDKIPALIGLERAKKKQIRHFSSGMKQRVKLGLAILSDTPLLCLDEPCSNLDQPAVEWYQALVGAHASGRLILVCSNEQNPEYSFCKSGIRMEDYKN